uniref:Uncharacterized protein n=1 Tax=Opuntia streptacantha TaxID=393608 RepID=A0A7C8ZT70_OPUST
MTSGWGEILNKVRHNFRFCLMNGREPKSTYNDPVHHQWQAKNGHFSLFRRRGCFVQFLVFTMCTNNLLRPPVCPFSAPTYQTIDQRGTQPTRRQSFPDEIMCSTRHPPPVL